MASRFKISEFVDYKDIPSQYNYDFIKNRLCIKLSDDGTSIEVAVAESRKSVLEELTKIHKGKTIVPVIVKDGEFAEFIGNILEQENSTENRKSGSQTGFSLENVSSEAPVVNIINAICIEAIKENASDIHIQKNGGKILIRFRIDGVLQTVKKLNENLFPSLVSRLKIMAALNVMENRLPQDGRIHVSYENQNIDFRISIVPVTSGQSIVLRLFDYKKNILKLDELDFSQDTYEKLKNCVKIPYGLILATGPTGSGKTTTLHALLQEMDVEHLKIVSIEDPVEREIEGIDQIQVNEEIGLTFESILRRVLRQDPDVIMVGEIRDKETAQLAVRAALTGHVILSTLHTNDSVSSISRLKNLGIEPYLISGILKYSMAQRLVRKKCLKCGGKGCAECSFTGYKGRTAVSEIFEMNETLEKLICDGKTDSEIKTVLKRQGVKLLAEDAKSKLEQGKTTIEELKREALI